MGQQVTTGNANQNDPARGQNRRGLPPGGGGAGNGSSGGGGGGDGGCDKTFLCQPPHTQHTQNK